MKYSHIIEQLYHRPWLITGQAHAAIRALVESRLAEIALDPRAAREGVDICGDAVELPGLAIEDGIGTIPIPGVLGMGLSKVQKGMGAVGLEDIEAELDQCMADDSVKGIILDFDSPGGTVAGIPELADKIAQAREKKDIYSFTRGQIASAAYWLAAGTDGIFATQSADVGSIGVYVPWMDQTKRFEAMGIRVELIKSGKLKGMGYPGTALSDEQKQHIQDGVTEIHNMFKSHVLRSRPGIDDETMQGQTFMGKKAAEKGLVDGIVTTIEDVRKLIKR